MGNKAAVDRLDEKVADIPDAAAEMGAAENSEASGRDMAANLEREEDEELQVVDSTGASART